MIATDYRFCAMFIAVSAIMTLSAPGCGCPQKPVEQKAAPDPEQPNSDKSEPEPATVEPRESPESSSAEQTNGSGGEDKQVDGKNAGGEQSQPTEGAGSPENAGGGSGSGAGTGPASESGSGESGGQAGSPASPSGNAAGSAPTVPPKGNARDASQKGKAHLAAARKSATSGKDQAAFQEAVRGWQAVAPFQNSAECRQVAGELRGLLEQLGDKLNLNVQSDSSKTQVVE